MKRFSKKKMVYMKKKNLFLLKENYIEITHNIIKIKVTPHNWNNNFTCI